MQKKINQRSLVCSTISYTTMEIKDYTSKKNKMSHIFYMTIHTFYSIDTLHVAPINYLSPLAALN